jgi:hypothetical protein
LEQILSYAINAGAGLFTLLFIALLIWVLRANDNRENRYLGVIDKYGDVINKKVDCVDGRVQGLEKDMVEVKADVKSILVNKN